MPSVSKKYPYVFHKHDGSYIIFDLTKADFDKVKHSLNSKGWVEVSIGMIYTPDLFAIVEYKEPPKEDSNSKQQYIDTDDEVVGLPRDEFESEKTYHEYLSYIKQVRGLEPEGRDFIDG